VIDYWIQKPAPGTCNLEGWTCKFTPCCEGFTCKPDSDRKYGDPGPGFGDPPERCFPNEGGPIAKVNEPEPTSNWGWWALGLGIVGVAGYFAWPSIAGAFSGGGRRAAKANPVSDSRFVFIEDLRSRLDVGDRQVRIDEGPSLGGYDTLAINYINLPAGIGSPGAEMENNRMMFFITGFHRTNPDAPAPTGKIKIVHSVSALPREYSLRGKTGTPSSVAKYLADFLNKVSREVEPRFTHTHVATGGSP
jgi:hypothetical protein